MKKSQIYSVVCKIFAFNFAFSPAQNLLDEIKKNPNWILRSSNEANIKGGEFYLKSLSGESAQIIKSDFENLKKYFSADFFFEKESEILTKLYEKCGFSPNLKTSSIDSVTNEFSFLSAFLELEASKDRNETAAIFLGVHLLPLIERLAPILQKEAKSDYYKAFGYFLEDFALIIEANLKIKVIKR